MRAAAGLLRLGQAVVIVFLRGRRITFAGAGDHLGVHVEDLLQLVAQRLAGADRLGAQPRGEAAQRVVHQDVAADHAGAGRHAVAHGVDHQLRPALDIEYFRLACNTHQTQR